MYIVAQGSVVVSRLSSKGDPVELARLGPGAFFGEMALVSSAPRAAKVHAEEMAVLLRADKDEMDSLASTAPRIGDVLIAFCHARMLENLMRVSPVLAPVPTRRRPDLIARFGTDYRQAGEVIMEQGSPGPGLFLIVSGRVNVVRDDVGDRVVLASLGAGDLFGEISLLMRKPSTATVVAEQNTALLFLPREEFEAATSEFPELLKGAYDIAVERENLNNSILGKAALDASDLVMV
jgi:cAMP-dependent protein kinase regulator